MEAASASSQLQIKQRRTENATDLVYLVLWPNDQKGHAVILHQKAGEAPTGSVIAPPKPVRALKKSEMSEGLFESDLAYQDAVENFFAWKKPDPGRQRSGRPRQLSDSRIEARLFFRVHLRQSAKLDRSRSSRPAADREVFALRRIDPPDRHRPRRARRQAQLDPGRTHRARAAQEHRDRIQRRQHQAGRRVSPTPISRPIRFCVSAPSSPRASALRRTSRQKAACRGCE